MKSSRTLVVTGGSGFIGSHLLADLGADPLVSQIIVLDQNRPKFESPKIEYVQADLRRPIAWEPADRRTDLQCVHLAAICREPGYSWDEYFDGNYLIAKNVADWASRIELKSMIFTSTAMVFKASERRNAEADLPNPDTAYGISKALAEETFSKWSSLMPGRQLHIIRPGVVFGKGGGGNFAKLYAALKRNLFCYVGRSTTVKSAIYIKDLVGILRAALEGRIPPDVYHALYDEPLTVGKVCGAFCEVYGWKRYIPTLPFRGMRAAAMPFEIADALGLKNPIHRRRIEKLYQSTNLSAGNLRRSGFTLVYPIADAIRDWRKECAPRELY